MSALHLLTRQAINCEVAFGFLDTWQASGRVLSYADAHERRAASTPVRVKSTYLFTMEFDPLHWRTLAHGPRWDRVIEAAFP